MSLRSIAQQLVVILLSLAWSSPDVRALDPSPAVAKPDQPLLTAGALDALSPQLLSIPTPCWLKSRWHRPIR